MDGIVVIDLVDCGYERVLTAIRGKDELPHREADFVGTFERGTFIGEVVGPLSNAYDGKRRRYAFLLQRSRPHGELLGQLLRDWRAFEYLSHGTPGSQAVGEFLRDAIRDRLSARNVGIECGKCGVVCIKRP